MDCEKNDAFHAFEARYNEEEIIDNEALARGIRSWTEQGAALKIVEASKCKRKTYLFDICKHCGKIIEKSS